jgi:hypothetical protein
MIEEEKENSDLSNLEAILKSISVEEAIASFKKIDKWIIEILECSSNDFLSLNNQFKIYHRESKEIAENASKIINSLFDSQLISSFEKLKAIVEKFYFLSEKFTSHVDQYDINLKKSLHKIEHIKIGYSNFRQSLVSLSLAIYRNYGTQYYADKVQAMDKEKMINFFNQADGLLNDFIIKVEKILKFLSEVKKENYSHLQILSDNIEICFELFSRKHEEANQLYSSLKEQSDTNASYVSNIITNLQYHDIIRQKIEHIQHTHQDIINDLESFINDNKDNTLLHNRAKTYIKIRDISGLQAAQLIHANNQYQVAIQEIFHSLEEIGNNMVSINCMCENLVGKSGQSKEYYLSNIIENLDKALQYNKKLMHVTSQIHDQINNLKAIADQLQNLNSEIFAFSQKILPIDIKLQPSDNQFVNLSNDYEVHKRELNNGVNELSQVIEGLFLLISEFVNENNLLQSFQGLNNTIPDLINLLKKSIKDVDEFLNLNSHISQNVSDEIRKTVENIKYYKLFEKNCENIINELNSLNIRLNYGYNPSVKEREENLKLLKSRYTMASEHIIHDRMSNVNNINEVLANDNDKIIEIANQKTNEDDDNLELF